ncbi:MAG: nucleotide sugar dehydrogenase [Planctomycetota bacterium]
MSVEAVRTAIESGDACVGVVGLGYVGLPLVGAMHDAGLRVLGYDTDRSKIDKLVRGEAYIRTARTDLFEVLSRSDRFVPTSNSADLAACDAVLLCVPTPLGAHHEPDLTFVRESARMVASVLKPGGLVVLESTTYPGTTSEEVAAALVAAGRVVGEDCFVAYSPEREDPGRQSHGTKTTPKLVGGVGAHSGELAAALYRRFVDEVHLVSSAEVAEAAKLLENIYRAVNIALVNELKVIFAHQGIDVWEVIEAAKTKPFGFQAFYPGPGLGGHCIPIDPYYLEWRARRHGDTTRFIELAGEINRQMPGRVVRRVGEALNAHGKALSGASVLVLGVAYKKDVDDIRESPAAEIITRLREAGAAVGYHDPFVPRFPAMRKYSIDLTSVELDGETVRAADAVVIVTDHGVVDYGLVADSARLVVDTRNAMASRGLVRTVADAGRGQLVGGGELWKA